MRVSRIAPHQLKANSVLKWSLFVSNKECTCLGRFTIMCQVKCRVISSKECTVPVMLPANLHIYIGVSTGPTAFAECTNARVKLESHEGSGCIKQSFLWVVSKMHGYEAKRARVQVQGFRARSARAQGKEFRALGHPGHLASIAVSRNLTTS
eukprot:380594-Pelagomonas_calceolata.AAC.6